MRQSDFSQRASKTEAMQKAEAESDEPRPARRERRHPAPGVRDLDGDQHDAERDGGLDRRARYVVIGQLVFVAVVLTVGEQFRRAIALCLDEPMVQRTVDRLDRAGAYVIGAVAAYWLIERTSAFLV
jgi:hypothetical protein